MSISNRYGFIVRTFDVTRTVWSDDERTIEGYDGTTRTTLHLFDTLQERDAALESVQVHYGESDDGSDCRTLWVGELSDISDGAIRLIFGEVTAR